MFFIEDAYNKILISNDLVNNFVNVNLMLNFPAASGVVATLFHDGLMNPIEG